MAGGQNVRFVLHPERMDYNKSSLYTYVREMFGEISPPTAIK